MKMIDLKSERRSEYGTETKLICKDGKSRWCYCTQKCYYWNPYDKTPTEKKLIVNKKTKQIEIWETDKYGRT